MSVNEDLVLTILRKIQEDLSAVKVDVAALRADIGETKDRLGGVERRLGAVEYRLSNVEGLMVENSRELRAVTQVVKQHGHRLDALEPPTP